MSKIKKDVAGNYQDYFDKDLSLRDPDLYNSIKLEACLKKFIEYTHWYVVYDSPNNFVAGMEARIKLSECCYQSIPLLSIDEFMQLNINNSMMYINSMIRGKNIINAKNISLQEIPEKFSKLKKGDNKGIIFYCSNGSLSLKETQKLVRQGEEMIYCLKGGIASWRNANLPLTKGLKNV